jgi:SAM-dependent methyltransferase
MSNYICAHYDSLSSTVEPSHPLAGLIQAYYQRDFYTQMLELAASALGRGKRALDIGCNVGGMTYRVAPSCAFVYGVDISFRATLIARRILLKQPEPLDSYRFYKEGLSFEERMLAIEEQRNVEVVVASGLSLPFTDGFFDFVNCANVVDVVGQPSDLLEDSLRVLKSGGRLLLADPYFWSPERTPIENWIGVETGRTTAEALRKRLEQKCDVISRKDRVLWLLRVYDWYFTLWLNDCILAQKR